MQSLRQEISRLRQEELTLDQHIQSLTTMLREMSENERCHELCYVTHLDLRSIPEFKEETLLAVTAPHGTKLTVPDPEDVRAFTLECHRNCQV